MVEGLKRKACKGSGYGSRQVKLRLGLVYCRVVTLLSVAPLTEAGKCFQGPVKGSLSPRPDP